MKESSQQNQMSISISNFEYSIELEFQFECWLMETLSVNCLATYRPATKISTYRLIKMSTIDMCATQWHASFYPYLLTHISVGRFSNVSM